MLVVSVINVMQLHHCIVPVGLSYIKNLDSAESGSESEELYKGVEGDIHN